MRYHALTLADQDGSMRWGQFAGRRPWLDLADPVCDVTLMFIGPDAGGIQPRLDTRSGQEIGFDEPVAAVPAGRAGFVKKPPGERRLMRLRFRFPGPQPVILRDDRNGRILVALRPRVVFPEFLFSLLEELRTGFCPEGIRHFVESGTLFGHTALYASYWVDQVITIELSRALHAEARDALAHRPNLRCLWGDSAQVLPELVGDLPGPTLFFLDAHWSGDRGVDWDASRWGGYPADTASRQATGLDETSRQVPLRIELETIAARHAGKAAVLIDDWESVGQKGKAFQGEDWSGLDRQGLLDWMTAHPRTRARFPFDRKRHLWLLEAV